MRWRRDYGLRFYDHLLPWRGVVSRRYLCFFGLGALRLAANELMISNPKKGRFWGAYDSAVMGGSASSSCHSIVDGWLGDAVAYRAQQGLFRAAADSAERLIQALVSWRCDATCGHRVTQHTCVARHVESMPSWTILELFLFLNSCSTRPPDAPRGLTGLERRV